MKEKTSKGKWIFIIIVLVVLWLISMLIAGVISIFIGGDKIAAATGNIAVIPIKGPIVATKSLSLFYEEIAASPEIVKFIEKADKNPGIRAIMFEINSPGGSAVASDEIAKAVKKTDKFTVAVIREVGASGAYWIASATDLIVANKMSITGSIGVISSYLEFVGLMEKYGVDYVRLVSGKYKDIGTPFKEISDEETKMLQSRLDKIREFFIEEVAENRKLAKKDVEKIAEGMFYLGSEAKELGLVDVLGTKKDAVEMIEKKYGIKAKLVEYKEKRGFLEMLSEVFSRQSFKIGQGIGNSLLRNEPVNDLRIYT